MEDGITRGECPAASDDTGNDTVDEPALSVEAECTVALPDDLAAELEDFCRARYVHREEAIRSLLADWLDRRSE